MVVRERLGINQLQLSNKFKTLLKEQPFVVYKVLGLFNNKLIMVSVSAVWVAVVSSSVSVTGICVSVSISAIVSFWFSISFGFTLVQLVDSISGSWGAYVLVESSSGKSVWGISVWGISITVWGIGTIEYSWVGISGSLATVVSMSVSVSVV